MTETKEYRDGAFEAAERANARAEDAETASEDAQAAARAAKASENAAAASASNAAADAAKAGPYAKAAQAAQEAAENAAAAAAASKSAADTLAAEAARAAQAAENSKAEAVKAQGTAQTAAKSAQDAQAAAETVRDDAKAAQKGAEAARDAAAKSAEAAAKSEANVKQSADTLAESVKNITPDDSSIGDKPWSSKHIIDMLCPPLQESGNPVVCYPVAGYPLGVKSKWEPMQDGSGTPYPAGGGPNKLNVAGIVSNRTISGITFTVNADGTIGVNGTSTAICFLNPNTKFNKAYLQKIPAGTYRLDFAQTALGVFLFGYYEDGSETPIVYAGNVVTYAQDAYVGPQIRIAAGATVNTTVRLMLHTGTSTPSAYAWWENIRPIKGRDSVTVERCGENLLNPKENNYNTYTPYGLTINYIGDNKVHLKGTYNLEGGGGSFVILSTNQKLLAGRNLKITGFTIEGTKQTYRLYGLRTKDETAIAMQAEFAKGDVIDMTVAIVVSKDTPTTYTPYNGSTDTLTLPETAYGGEVDAVTGEGQENTKIITLDGNELKFSQRGIYYNLPNHSAPGILARGIICCSHFNSTLLGVNTSYDFCFLLKSDADGLFASVDDLNAYLAAQYAAGTPVQIAYKLAEPIPFTATGAQPIPALAGVNTVLTDADSATVTGRADPIKRITDLEDAVASQT